MNKNQLHCRALSKVPAIAMADREDKIQTAIDIVERLTIVGRQKAWGIYVPPTE